MRELQPREVKCLTQGHAGSRWQGRADPNPPPHFPKPTLCTCSAQQRTAELPAAFPRVLSAHGHALCSHGRLSRAP